LLLISCSSTPKATNLQEIKIGATKQEIVDILGQPHTILGNTRNCYGQIVETWQYRLTLPKRKADKSVGKVAGTLMSLNPLAIDSMFKGPQADYWLHFFRDELVYWSRARNWKMETERIYWMNFETNTADSLSHAKPQKTQKK